MRNILAPAHRGVLEEFARSHVLLAFDFDGTLTPIVDVPSRARMRPATRGLLEGLTELYPIVVISGRARPDVMRRLGGVRVRQVLGNHGIEPWGTTARLRNQVRRWRPLLRSRLGALHGVHLEDKIFSISVHYRQARDKRTTRAVIGRAAAALGDVRVVGGKQVVNILPWGAPHKGVALERTRRRLRCDTTIYVGDDETDEDVFALAGPGRHLSIRVGASRSSRAAYSVRNQLAVDDLLSAMLELRSRSRRGGRAGR